MQTIAERLESARTRIEQAAIAANRLPNSVQLLAVSKTKPVSDIHLAYEAGHRLFGENYVQEGVEKVQALQELDIIWHMIGPIQSNKTRLVAEHFDWVQSIDREKIAQRLNDQRPAGKPPIQICIQVNIDDEETKSGVHPQQLDALVKAVSAMPNLCLRGLMAIPRAHSSDAEQAEAFKRMQQLFEQYHTKLTNFDTLSMGMSDDLESAISNGSTMVRIGTAIFGKRT